MSIKVITAIAAVFGSFNLCVKMNKCRNITKIIICVFAIFGMIACSSGGSGGSSTSAGGNEPPQFTSIDDPSVVENTTAVLTLVATDDDGDTVTYSLGSGNDEDLFVITGNVLSFKIAPDFESPNCDDNTCTVSIIASDGTNSTTQTITITIANATGNEPPQFTSADSANVAENTTAVITIDATDDDGDNITYMLGSNNDEDLFNLSVNILSFKTAPDFESPDCGDNTCIVSITASDNTNDTTQTITINVTNVNESPQITSTNTVNIPENTTDVIIIEANDDGGDNITYTLGSNNDEDLFNLSVNILSFKSAPDFESPACSGNASNTCTINVIASDGVNSTTQTITVTVTNVNDNNPKITSANSATVPEKRTAVLSLVATDDDGDDITYTLDSTQDASLFDLSADTNILSFNTAPDYKIPACSDNSCSVTVTASDGVNPTTQIITITVVEDSDGDGTPNITDDDDDNDGVLDITDVDDDNDGLIEIHNLDMLHHIRYNLAGTSYKTSDSDIGNTTGVSSDVPTTCSDAGKAPLCAVTS